MSTKHRCDNCQLLITVETNEHGVPLIVDTDASEWQGYDETEKDDRRLLRDAEGEPYGLSEIEDLHERLDPGAVTPSGQCPACGCLAYPVREGVQVAILFGSDAVHAFEDDFEISIEAAQRAAERAGGEFETFGFATEVEARAFREGLSRAQEWENWTEVPSDITHQHEQA